MIFSVAFIVSMALGLALIFLLSLANTTREDSRWAPLSGPGVPEAVLFHAIDTQLDVRKLVVAVARAVDALNEHGPWERGIVSAALKGVKIQVQPFERWPTQEVGEESEAINQALAQLVKAKKVCVGPRFIGLAHELAHVVEHRTTGIIDHTHVSWTPKGIQKAVDGYEAWSVSPGP